MTTGSDHNMTSKKLTGAESIDSAEPVTVSSIVDPRPVGRSQILVLVLCGFVMFLDGFDTQALSFAAPALAKEWGLAPPELGTLLSAAIFGLMVGYLGLSSLGNKVGHRRVIIFATAAFGVLTLLCSFAAGPTELIVLRFLTGMGLGAAIPSVVALTSEFAPRRRRSTFVLFIYCWLALGFVAAGLVSGVVIPQFGWRAMFVVGGALPLVLVVVIIVFLPESPRYLLTQLASAQRLRALLLRIDPSLPATTVVGPDADDSSVPGQAGSTFIELLRRRWLASTLLLWVAFIANLATFYSIQSWMPSIVGSLGQDPSVIIAATVLTSVGGIVAATIIGPSMDRINPFLILGSVYILGSVFVTILGRSLDGEAWVLLVAAFLAGTCVTGGQMSIVAVASLVYPARLRSTGVGWALGIGRLGGIIGPILVGSALGGGVAPATVFLVISVLLIAASASIFMLGTIARSRAAAN
jgi:AAHS family 4-hydroxybenzoate transporter-like MFS transporter